MLGWIVGTIVLLLLIASTLEALGLIDLLALVAAVVRLFAGAVALLAAALMWSARKLFAAQRKTPPVWRDARNGPKQRGSRIGSTQRGKTDPD